MWQDLQVRIAWNRCHRRRWAAVTELDFSPEQRRKRHQVLLYFWAGEGRRRTPAGEVAVRAGSGHWSRPGWSYACHQSSDQPLGITALHFDLLDATGAVVPPADLDLPPEVLQVRQPALVNELTGYVADLAMQQRAGAVLAPATLAAAEALLHGLLLTLAADTGHTAPAGGTTVIWPDVIRYLHEHLQAPLEITGLARRWGYTRSHFSRLFQAQVGVSPHRYVLRARIASAKELLRDTKLPVSTVADLAGFGDATQFSRRFRLMTGVTPQAYRLQAG